MKITQTKVDTRVPSGSEGVDYEIRHKLKNERHRFFYLNQFGHRGQTSPPHFRNSFKELRSRNWKFQELRC